MGNCFLICYICIKYLNNAYKLNFIECNLSLIIRIIRYLMPYRLLAALNFFFNGLSVVFSLFSIVMVIPLLQLIFNLVPDVTTRPVLTVNAKSLLEYIKYLLSMDKRVHGPIHALIAVCGAIILVFFFKNLFRYLALRVLSPIRTGVMRDIRNDMFAKLLTLPLSYYSGERKGDLMSRMTDDIRAVEQGIFSMLEDVIIQPLTIVLFLVWMLMLNASLTLFALLMLGIVGLVIGGVGKTLKRQSLKIQETVGRAMSIVEESVSGLRIIQGFSAEGYKQRQFRETNQVLYEQGNRINKKFELSSPLTEFLAIAVFSSVLWFGGGLVIRGEMEAANFIQLILTFALLIQPAKSFSTAFYKIRIGLASSERIFEILDAENTIRETADAKPMKSFKESIEYKNVSFSYKSSGHREILKGINLRVDLLPRFYDVLSGEIVIDGQDIRQASLTDLRGLFGIVSQEPILFNDTVLNNIVFGKENISHEQIEQAARVANAHDFISRLPQGYDTVIGDRGGKLSGGERQRLTIARAVLKDPPILILDEATSSLDSESEKLVQDALAKLMKDRTTIVIAHRLSTIQTADEIIVMSEGKIAERGIHSSLMQQAGIYSKLVELQAFD
jgi:ABC-type multidrug transport system fused ATPase/permease subunit